MQHAEKFENYRLIQLKSVTPC